MSIGVDTEKELNAVDFLEAAKEDPKAQNLGRHVVVIGAGNTAMDAHVWRAELKAWKTYCGIPQNQTLHASR